MDRGASHRLTDFDIVGFTSAAASDDSLTDGAINDFTNDVITLVNHPGPAAVVRACPSDLASDGTAFDVTYGPCP